MRGEAPAEFESLVASTLDTLKQAAARWGIQNNDGFEVDSHFFTDVEGVAGMRWIGPDGLIRGVNYWFANSYESHGLSLDGVEGWCRTQNERREKTTGCLYTSGDSEQLNQIYEQISGWTSIDLARPSYLDVLDNLEACRSMLFNC